MTRDNDTANRFLTWLHKQGLEGKLPHIDHAENVDGDSIALYPKRGRRFFVTVEREGGR